MKTVQGVKVISVKKTKDTNLSKTSVLQTSPLLMKLSAHLSIWGGNIHCLVCANNYNMLPIDVLLKPLTAEWS